MIKNRMAQRGQGGFTLIELLVVVAILAILGGAAIIGIGAMRENAAETVCKSDQDTLKTAAIAAQVQEVPAGDINPASLVSLGLLEETPKSHGGLSAADVSVSGTTVGVGGC